MNKRNEDNQKKRDDLFIALTEKENLKVKLDKTIKKAEISYEIIHNIALYEHLKPIIYLELDWEGLDIDDVITYNLQKCRFLLRKEYSYIQIGKKKKEEERQTEPKTY